MCIAYLRYWPRQNMPSGSNCGFRRRGEVLGGAIPYTGEPESEFTQRVFGVLPGATPGCMDDATFSHPAVGGCANFDRLHCESYGWDVVGALGTARDKCCVCNQH